VAVWCTRRAAFQNARRWIISSVSSQLHKRPAIAAAGERKPINMLAQEALERKVAA
jgi:predicted HicB family RNase H-like nuclease